MLLIRLASWKCFAKGLCALNVKSRGEFKQQKQPLAFFIRYYG